MLLINIDLVKSFRQVPHGVSLNDGIITNEIGLCSKVLPILLRRKTGWRWAHFRVGRVDLSESLQLGISFVQHPCLGSFSHRVGEKPRLPRSVPRVYIGLGSIS